MSNHTDYRLEIWDGKQYRKTYAYSDGSREEHNDVIRALIRSDDGIMPNPDYLQYRIVKVSKERPLKPRAPRLTTSTRPTMADSISMREQAQAAAEHYRRLRKRADDGLGDLAGAGLLPVHVFPVKPSGRGMASDFRLELARLLTDQVPMTRGTFWGKSANETRLILEGRLGLAGYKFVEVDPDDYS